MMPETSTQKHTAQLEHFRYDVFRALTRGRPPQHIYTQAEAAIAASRTYTELRTTISNILSDIDHGTPWGARFSLMGELTSIFTKIGEARAQLEKEVFDVPQ